MSLSARISGEGPRRRASVFIAVLFVLAAVLLLGFYLGQRAAYSGMGLDPEIYHNLQGELPALRDDQALLQGELEVQKTRHEVDRAALEMVRRQLVDQNTRMLKLQESLRFYQGLMSPESIQPELSLRSPELVAYAQSPTHFSYRLVVQQQARSHELVRGKLQVYVFGLLAGEPRSFALADVSKSVESAEIPLRFRYFQSIEGEMVLPEMFLPQGINVVAVFSRPRKTELSKRFAWQLQKGFTDVGQ